MAVNERQIDSTKSNPGKTSLVQPKLTPGVQFSDNRSGSAIFQKFQHLANTQKISETPLQPKKLENPPTDKSRSTSSQSKPLKTAKNKSGSPAQRLIRVSPVDVDPATGAVHSNFTAVEFGAAMAALPGANGGNFWRDAALPINNNVRANLTYATVNAALAAPYADIPALAVAVVNAISGGNGAINARLGANIADLEYALGQNAPTTAGGGDVTNFRRFQAGGAVMSRSKGVPNRIPVGNLTGALATAGAALTARRGAIAARNAQLDAEADYIAGLWAPRARANQGMAGIRSGHENGAGWLPTFVAAPPEAALYANILNLGTVRSQSANDRYRAMGWYLRQRHNQRANASQVEADIDGFQTTANINAQELKNYFYRVIFWGGTTNRAGRVHLAWARYGTDNSGIVNCPYIEFNGGGAASRIIWDYVNDNFYLSAHYNWVDGFNSHFQVTGVAATY
mgnify:CR=1 FL=1